MDYHAHRVTDDARTHLRSCHVREAPGLGFAPHPTSDGAPILDDLRDSRTRAPAYTSRSRGFREVAMSRSLLDFEERGSGWNRVVYATCCPSSRGEAWLSSARERSGRSRYPRIWRKRLDASRMAALTQRLSIDPPRQRFTFWV